MRETSTGWFFGFKLHLVINDRGELLNVLVTPGNVDDRKPVPRLVCRLFGKIFGDKGCISQPLYELFRQTIGVQLVTKLKSNSKNRLPMPLTDHILIRKRAIVETVIDQLKGINGYAQPPAPPPSSTHRILPTVSCMPKLPAVGCRL